MAMLAEPRRKQKVINLRAKNNAWSNDNTKWGQRMLEKMGWSSGKGLGANENGIVEHVVARYKNDDRGLGFEDRNDQWTKHEDDFNSLLANLSNGDTKEEKLHSGVSLEDKSKKSKARVHYHKFTRGKDLTRYSEKDLANIFGKKSLKIKEKASEINAPVKDEVKATEVVFTEKGSMEDYFKSKLASLKGKNKVSFENCDNENDEADYSFRGFTGAGGDEPEVEETSNVAFQGFSFYNTKTNVDKIQDDEQVNAYKRITKKKNKKNKSKKDVDCQEYHENESQDQNEKALPDKSVEGETETIEKKKSKKGKHKIECEEESTEEPPKKKKSKNKTVEDNPVVENHIDEVVHVPKKKKKRKNKINDV